jgi:hypothetical protein
MRCISGAGCVLEMIAVVEDRAFVLEVANPAAMKDAICLFYGFYY